MPRVYVPMQPAKLDPATRLWIPTANLKPAEQYGELVIMFQQTVSRAPSDLVIEELRAKMNDFGDDDYVCAVGDPALIAAAACIAARRNGGRVRLLRWDRQAHGYNLVEFTP